MFKYQHLFCLLILGCPAAFAEDIPFVLDSTYEERIEKSNEIKPAKTKQLYLPHCVALRYWKQPQPIEAGEQPKQIYYDYRNLWSRIPWQDKHATYLEQRQKLKGLNLVNWCETNKLPTCAEFELRNLLFPMGNFQSLEYQRINKRWARYAPKRKTKLSFPLPLIGEWYVAIDHTKHHQKKHWAYFAFDMVIQKGGRQFSGRQIYNREAHYAWDQPVVAQADGIVMRAKDHFKDAGINKIAAGAKANRVTIDYGGGIIGVYAHLKQGSVTVKVGDRVKAGQVIGKVGNSGASALPHLHFELSDYSGFSIVGLFQYEVKRGTKWVKIKDQPLREGTYIRNIPGIFKKKQPKEETTETP